MLEMGAKPFEARITKRPGGRHFERYAPSAWPPAPGATNPPVRGGAVSYNWHFLSVLVDVAYMFTSGHNSKWLVLRSNHLAYYNDVDEVVPHMVFSPAWSPEKMSEDAKFALGF